MLGPQGEVGKDWRRGGQRGTAGDRGGQQGTIPRHVLAAEFPPPQPLFVTSRSLLSPPPLPLPGVSAIFIRRCP